MTYNDFVFEFDQTSDYYFEQRELDIYRKKDKSIVRYYFDSFDIGDMIDGLRGFQSNYTILTDDFDQLETVIQALAYSGNWLGKNGVGLLPGHREEVYDYIKLKYAPRQSTFDKKYVNDLFDFFNLKGLKLSEDLSKREISNRLAEIRNKSSDLFKLNFILDRSDWLDRSNYLIADVLYLESSYDNRCFESDLFNDLFDFFEKERPQKTKSNFKDACALFHLSMKAQDFQNNESKELPLFFASTSLMQQLENNKSLKKHFMINLGGRELFILKNAEFIFLDTIFNKVSKSSLFYDHLKVKDEMPSDELEFIKGNKIINSNLNSAIKFKFFDLFWYRRGGDKVITKVIKDFVNYQFIISDKVKEIKKHDWEKILISFLGGTISLKLVSDLWEEVIKIPEELGGHVNLIKKRDDTNLLAEFGLIRFGFAENMNNFLRESVFSLIGEDDRQNRKFQNLIVSMLPRAIDNISKHQKVKSFDDLESIISVLWIFERYSLIIQIVEKVNHLIENSFTIQGVYLASLIRDGRNPEKFIRKFVYKMDTIRVDRKYKLHIIQSYLIFNYWDYTRDGHELIPEFEDESLPVKEITKATDQLELAINWLFVERNKDKDKVLVRNTAYAYALNNYVYYVTRTGSPERFNKIGKFIRKLVDLKSKANTATYWQNRFSETIALYKARTAVLNWSNVEYRKKLLEEAKELTMEAKNKSLMNSKRYDVTLELIHTAIFYPDEIEEMIA